jgi:O-acetylhomoserine (thiol)-lyase
MKENEICENDPACCCGSSDKLSKNTRAIHVAYRKRDAYDALSVPVYNSVAFEFDNAQAMTEAFTGKSGMPDYSRTANPTVTNLEDRVQALTGADNVIAFNSGMAAISNALLALTAAGTNVVTSRHLFGNTYSLLTGSLKRFGVETRCVDLTDLDAVAAAIDEHTACVYFEIITNPQMEVVDIKALSTMAHHHGTVLVADTTTIPFTQFSCKSLGVDVEVLSSTKYISGGATSLGGLVIDYGSAKGFANRIKNEQLFNFGAYMTPQVAFLQTIGLETLAARYRVQSDNALQLATKLSSVKKIQRVNYVGLPDNPYYALAQKQFGPTAGAMICIDLVDQDACFRFIDRLKLIHRATNLFDNRSLAIHPYSTIFGNFTAEEKRQMDVLDTTVRLSIGLEDVNDLYADIIQALA